MKTAIYVIGYIVIAIISTIVYNIMVEYESEDERYNKQYLSEGYYSYKARRIVDNLLKGIFWIFFVPCDIIIFITLKIVNIFIVAIAKVLDLITLMKVGEN